MRKRVQQTIHRHTLLKNGDTVIVGVSGGADSMALLDVLARSARTHHYTLIVAHVCYGVRGAAAYADRERVRTAAAHDDASYEELDLSTQAHPHDEAWMRDARYAFFERVRQTHNAAAIAVGHHRDDLVETFLLGLVRGSGLAGLSALRYKHGTIVRPLLDVTKDDILTYCAHHAIPYGADSTNADTTYLRNRVRHELVPYLRAHYNPRIDDVLAHTAHTLRDDYVQLTDCTNDLMPSYTRTGATLTFAAADFMACSASVQRLFLRRCAAMLSKTTPSFGAVENWRTLIASTKNKTQTARTNALIVAKKGATVHMTARA